MKRENLYNVFIFVIFIGLASSCDNTAANREAAVRDSLENFYTVVIDSLDSTWTFMMNEDDVKHSIMKQLLDEIKLTNEYDEEAVDSLLGRLEDTRASRYDKQSMGNQTLIDEYDFAMSSLIKEITTQARSNPQFQNFPRMKELIDNIQYLDQRVLIHRVHYDYFAKGYNELIQEHSELVNEFDPEDSQTKVNVFQIME